MLSFAQKRRQQAALCRAIYERNLETVGRILLEGLDPNFIRRGFSPLCRAVWRGDRPMVDFLISRGACIALPGNIRFLYGAAMHGDHDLIDRALAAGHDIHLRPRLTPTPLEAAAFANHTETIRYLWARGSTAADFDSERCRWSLLRPQTVDALLEIGVPVPEP